MDQDYFRSILKKYLQGQATPEEKRIIDSWYDDMGVNFKEFSDPQEESELENKYWSHISSHVRRNSKSANHSNSRVWCYVGLAASLVIALLSGICIVQNKTQEVTPMLTMQADGVITWQAIANSGKEPRRVVLPDSSKVTLQPQSKIRFSTAFGEADRVVCLEGEAFFEVVRNENSPFLVHANGLTTKVLGTSFTVKAFRQERNVTVEVRTGKVSVFPKKGRGQSRAEDEVILTSNQKIVYDKAVKKISRTIVDIPQVTLPLEEVKRMRFESAPVKEIFTAIEKVYGVDLVFDEARFSACTLTTAISDGDIYNRLDIICKVIGATYELKEDRIVISGEGCLKNK